MITTPIKAKTPAAMHRPEATIMSISLSFNANIRMVKQTTAATNRMKEMHSTAFVSVRSAIAPVETHVEIDELINLHTIHDVKHKVT